MGPRFPNWSWRFEMTVHYLKTQTARIFGMSSPAEGREYEDALVILSNAINQVDVEHAESPVTGDWYTPKSGSPGVSVLYLHGGGYAYYPKAHSNLTALVTLAAKSKTFALDYRLAPEHPFPAQLQDALAAYRWLLESGIPAKKLVIMGDSAGGHLTIALLLSLRGSNMPLPALGICLCPWTDAENSGASMTENEANDWIDGSMAVHWANWFCGDADRSNPLISPNRADLRGLPPIYIQAGSAEILYDMNREFANTAQAQGANVTLDVWKNMIHDFQAFGDTVPESKEALARIGEVIAKYVN